MDANMTGVFIAQLRRDSSLTQKQLADRLNVSDKAVSRWETGKGYPDIETLVALGNIFGITVNELLAGVRVTAAECGETAEKNIIEISKGAKKTRRRLLIALTITWGAAVFAVVFCVVFIQILLMSVHLDATRYAHAYEETAVVKGKYILQTVRSDDHNGVPMATFTVLDADTGACLFRTEESWRTRDLNGIEWDPYSYNIIVDSSDVGTYIYAYVAKTGSWLEQP